MSAALLEARGIVKNYGHVQALRGADFSVEAGKVVAMVGDNGAGKSTLVKVLSGIEQPDGGEIRFEGQPVALASAARAHALGIETVYQDLALAPDLDPAANLFLGRELLRDGVLGRLGFLDNKRMQQRAEEAFADLGQTTVQQVTVPVASLSGGQRQSVAVARASAWASKVVFMDEPTAALGVVQASKVLDLIRRVRDQGIAVVLISHSMPQVFDVADRIEVLRLGQRVARFDPHEADMADIVGAMTGALEHGEASTAEPGGSSEQARQRGPSGQEDA
ncbi:MAG: sugar ABC transporter ATP-binding protein [Euzebyales bacterium]|jgi:simple sugar transport system ATP-binding protein|nr:sugar ABC transporter ATP-binding protein [Euzebyales bacterium]